MQKQNQTVPSAQTNPSSSSTVQSTTSRNNAANGVQQSFPPINPSQVQNPASQQPQQQSSQINQTNRLPVLLNQQQTTDIHIDEENDEEDSTHQQLPQQQQQSLPPTYSSSSDIKPSSSSKVQEKSEDLLNVKDTKYLFGLKTEPKSCRPTRAIKIDDLEKYLKEKKYQNFLNELEIVELFADLEITATVYVLLVAGYVITKKVFQIQYLISKYSENNKLENTVNDSLLDSLICLVSDQNSIEMWKNLISLYEKDLPKQKCLSEYTKLFPLITECMKEVMNKKEVELTEQQEKMRLYLLENKNNRDKTFCTIKECVKNLTEVDPNVAK